VISVRYSYWTRARSGVSIVEGIQDRRSDQLISERRGRRSNRHTPDALRRAVLAIIHKRKRWWDFAPTLVAEKLCEAHGITVGRETVRQWMIEAGLWRDRRQHRKQVHQPRYRRWCVDEIAVVDVVTKSIWASRRRGRPGLSHAIGFAIFRARTGQSDLWRKIQIRSFR
jgi:hypothetical protein